MIVYRVFPYLPSAKPGEPGHPMYLHRPQGKGRLDNSDLFDVWYFGLVPEVAIGESFADQRRWSKGMFPFPDLKGARRVLGLYTIDENAPILEMDDANTLYDRALRPTQVVSRNRSVTQQWAKKVFEERTSDGRQRWSGVQWWSYHRPHWRVLALFVARGENPTHEFIEAVPLSLQHPAVVEAAKTLGKRYRLNS